MTDIPTGFTPGPWVANGNAIETAEGEYIASMSSPRGVPQREVDARLIASAPAMAEEIKRLRMGNRDLQDHFDNLKTDYDALRALNAELVEGLKHVMGWIDGWSPNFTLDDEWPEYEHNIRRAIAKAEGR